jgi:hypothetical protein
MKKLLLYILLTGFIHFGKAQNVQIIGYTYAPSSPLSCQDLIFSVNHRSFCAAAQLPFDSISHTIVGNTINIGVYYRSVSPICQGVIGNHLDNENVGMLAPGTYTVTVKGYINLNPVSTPASTNVTVLSCCNSIASFTTNQTFDCLDDLTPFIFTNTSTGNTTNTWYLNGFQTANTVDFTLSPNIAGNYTVALVTSDGTCTDSTWQNIAIHENPILHFGNDTTICVGQNLSLQAPTGLSNYAWSNSSNNTATQTYQTAGVHFLTITDNNGCTATDSIALAFHEAPVVFLGNDTSVCANSNFELDAGNFSAYAWNTGQNTQTISINSSFNYAVTITDANQCTNSDNISVFVYAPITVDLGNDSIAICADETVTLAPSSVYTNYAWSTGEFSNTLEVGLEGLYILTVSNANNCSAADSVFVTINEIPELNFGADTNFICTGESISLHAGTFETYLWNTGAQTASIITDIPGNYTLTVSNEFNCENTGSIYVSENALPIITLGEDKELCSNETLVLDAGNFESYLWSNGLATQTITLNGNVLPLGNNTYSVEVTDANGCKGIDEVIVNVKECNVAIKPLAQDKSISIYPIPVKSTLHIASKTNVISHLKLYNILGTTLLDIKSYNVNNHSTLDVSHLVNGIYFIEMIIDGNKIVKQFVKNN